MFESVLLNSFFFFTFVDLVLFIFVVFFIISGFILFNVFYYIMPSITSLSCEEQKRMKGDKFYFVDSIPNPLLVNNLRQTYDTKKRKLVEVSNILNSKVCQTCHKLSKKPCMSSPSDQNEPDLSIYRKKINCHSRCTFNYKDIENLISVSNMIRHELLMNDKFLAQYNARMCSKHVGITNY